MKKAILIFAFCILNFLGCASAPKTGEATVTGPKALEAQAAIKFGDIPLPAGFKFLYKDSYSFQSGNMRVAVLRYSGRPNVEQTFKFFQEQMPIYNWRLINTVEYGRRMLNFEREQETCIITIEPKRFSTEIAISIGPKQTLPQRTEKPIK